MNLVKNKIKSMYRTSIVFSLVLFFVGLFLLIEPETTLHAISYIVGIILIVWGIIPVIGYLSNKENQGYLDFSFVLGIFSLIIGIIIVINPNIIGSIIPLLLGIWMLINGITKLQYSLNLKKYEKDSNMSVIISVIILICGLVLIFNPFKGAVVLTQIIGGFIIAYSILDIMECLSLKKTIKKVENEVKKDKKDNIIEAVYEEE